MEKYINQEQKKKDLKESLKEKNFKNKNLEKAYRHIEIMRDGKPVNSDIPGNDR